MQVCDLRCLKPCFIPECSLGIKGRTCDPNMLHLLAVTIMNN